MSKELNGDDSIFGLYLALDSQPEYKSGKEIDKSAQIHISPPTLEYFSKIFYECRGEG
jgi:beta-carotene ketolase (CrtO type)